MEIPLVRSDGKPRTFVFGHGNKGKSNTWKARPDSINKRTGRYRARLLHDCSKCELAHIGGCSGRVEIHHKDDCPMNNEEGNVIALCTSHHRLIHNGRIDLQQPVMPPFVIRGGKRRYMYSYSAMNCSDAAKLREAKKRSGGQ